MTEKRKLQLISDEDIAINISPQLMICLLVDASYSMNDDNRISIVNNGIRQFIKTGKDDYIACDSLDICIITFGGLGAKVIQPFTNIKNITFKDIHPNGGTPLASALDLALKEIDNRHEYWKAAGNPVFHPWLIVLSDGNSDQSISEQANIIQERYRNHKLKGKCIGVGSDLEIEDIKKIAPNNHVETMTSFQLDNFFSFLSRSAASLSASSPELDDNDSEIKIGKI